MNYRDYIYHTCKLRAISINGWRLLGYSILTLLLINIISNLIIYFIPVTSVELMSRIVESPSYVYNKLLVFWMGVILFPLLEELAFSYFFGKKRHQVVVSTSLLFGVFITAISFLVFEQLAFSLSNFFFVWIGSSLFAFFWVVLPVISPKVSFVESIYYIIQSDVRPIGYFTVFLFAAFHIYFVFIASHSISLFPAIFLFLFYMIFRLIINQIRISKNFLLAVGFHSLYNLWAYWEIFFP